LVESLYRMTEALAMGGMSMPTPISLTDAQLDEIMTACRPLQPRDRDLFLKAVAQAIVELPERGDGAIHRAIASVWRQHFDPPDLRIGESRSRVHA
jgi:hypothetical protein